MGRRRPDPGRTGGEEAAQRARGRPDPGRGGAELRAGRIRGTRPQGLYLHPDIELKKLRRLIVEAKLAPCFPGSDDHRPDLDECPICFLFYPSLNRSKCCAKGICTECFLQMKSPTSCRPTQCPFCKMLNYAVEYRSMKTKEEKGIEQLRLIEAQIRMRQQELQEDAEWMKNKQTAALTDAMTTAQVECFDTSGASTPAGSSAQGNDGLSSQVHHSEFLLRNYERLKQIRYVVRAKAGKRQSGKDATGKVAHSAGSSLRRYNEAALKKEVQELIVSWKSYFDACVSAFIYAPSKNRQMLFDGDKAQSVLQECDIRPVPLTVHQPTLKEAKRVYSNLTQLYYEQECSILGEVLPHVENVTSFEQSTEAKQEIIVGPKESMSGSSLSLDSSNKHEEITIPLSNNETTPLHEAAKSGNVQQTLELLEQGLDPCIKDERGKTPYLLASDKEVRNTFRRFMALNLDKWDWHASDVPSALTKEMEDSQTAKQAEKDAKKKARAKELMKLKKAREKEKEKEEKEKEKAQASQSQTGV